MKGKTRRKLKKLYSHRTDSSNLQPGDHIYVYRLLKTYSHHGIYLGGDDHLVIHLTKKGTSSTQGEPCSTCGYDKSKSCGLVKTCLRCFIKEENLLGGNSVYVYEYGVSKRYYLVKRAGTCSRTASKPPNEVIQIATELYKNCGFHNYNLHYNNCEDFATSCKTGDRRGKQVAAAYKSFSLGIVGLVLLVAKVVATSVIL